MILRDYQHKALESSFSAWESGLQRIALVCPTGSGKTIIFSHIIREFIARFGGQVLVLAHRGELLEQASEKIHAICTGLSVGLVKAGSNQVGANIIVASQQTLIRASRRALLPRFGLVIVDESHRSMGESYLKVLEDLGCFDPGGPKTLGVTATFSRDDSKRLTDFYQAVPFALDIVDLIEQGHLVAPKFRRVLIEGLDLSGVQVTRREGGRDLAPGELGEALDQAGAPGVVAAAYARHARDRSGLIFTPTVASAEHVAEAMRAVGITCEALSGNTPAAQRRDTIARFRSGQLQTVSNCSLFGEGFDAPIVDCVVIARPTISKVLFRQMVGRGLRPYPGKQDALILDVVGATGRNDLKTLNDLVDRPVDLHEDERLDDGLKRATAEREQTLLTGDAHISGSLEAVDVDPWTIEMMRGRPRKADGSLLSEEDLAKIAAEKELERQQRAEEKERRERRRYKPVPMRSGWFLMTPKGRFFIPLETQARQKGFVVVFEAHGQHHVALWLEGTTSRVLQTCETDAEAGRAAINFVLALVEVAMDRYMVDPDAKWRRKPASQKQIDFADQLVSGVDWDEYHYSGQCGDFITWGRMHRNVDSFADSVASEVNSDTLTAATASR